MNEASRPVLDTETPVNPYSLLDAVNRSSNSANAAWLISIAVMAYVAVTMAGVTHKDLLLNNDVTLPLLQVKVGLIGFFVVAPILVVLLHAGVLAQLVLLARKALEFHAAIRMLESTDERSHPLRLELDNFFFVQAVAGPERSRIVSFFLHAITWLTVMLLPVALLLYVQLMFLPFHAVPITWVHRLALLADIAVLASIGLFLWRLETSYFRALWRTSRHHPIGLALSVPLLAAVALFSLFVATIPGEAVDRMGNGGVRGERDAGIIERAVIAYAMPLTGAHGDILLGLFHRNLSVTDADLVADKDVVPGQPSLSLRGRDLRFARLDRSDLHQADLTGADLDGASLSGADLRGAWLGCADMAPTAAREDHGS